MTGFLALALELAGLSARRTARRAARVSLLVFVAMQFLILGFAGLAAALWIVLARATDPAAAALIVGGIGLVAAGVLLLVARAQFRRARPAPVKLDELARQLKDTERALSALMTREDGGTLWTPVLMAALIGFLITGR